MGLTDDEKHLRSVFCYYLDLCKRENDSKPEAVRESLSNQIDRCHLLTFYLYYFAALDGDFFLFKETPVMTEKGPRFPSLLKFVEQINAVCHSENHSV